MTWRTKTLLGVLAWVALGALWLRPAHAGGQDVVGRAAGDGAVLTLYAGQGPCMGNARYAEHKAPDGAVTPGCWLLAPGRVYVAFLDGERGDVPVAAITWAKGI